MKNYGSRKFLIALLLSMIVVIIFLATLNALPVDGLVVVFPTLIGFCGIVLGAVAVMYPVSNTLETKWKKDE